MMPSFPFSFALALLTLASLCQATLYVTNPDNGEKCHGGQDCTIEWLDDGVTPQLADIGAAKIGLYTGNQQLVQTIAVIDVSASRSLTFQPIPEAGPNSSRYYICFSSLAYTSEDGQPYLEFSTSFSIDGMSGSFDSPLASATASQTVPTSLTASDSGSSSDADGLSTRTVGTLSSSSYSYTSLSATPPSSTYTPTTSQSASSQSSSSSAFPSSSGDSGDNSDDDNSDAAFSLSPLYWHTGLVLFISVTLSLL